jgi:hypothetical protein
MVPYEEMAPPPVPSAALAYMDTRSSPEVA